MLEKGNKAFVSDSEDEEGSNKKGFIENKKKEELTYNEEQEQLKKRWGKITQLYSRPCQTSKMERFAKIVIVLQPLSIFANTPS